MGLAPKDNDMAQMTQNQKEESNANKVTRLHRLCGPPPVLSSEEPDGYDELLVSLLEYYKPRNFLGEMFVRHLADHSWEIKALVVERRFHQRLKFQAQREKAALRRKEELATMSDENDNGRPTLPEETPEGLAEKMDATPLRPAEELDHAGALEAGIGYYEQLDRLLARSIARLNEALEQIDQHPEWFHPTLTLLPAQQVSESTQGRANEGATPPLVPTEEGQP